MLTAVNSKQQILDTIEAHSQRIRALGVRRLGLFGSFVRGEQTPESDVDFLVEFEPRLKTFRNFMDLAFLLEDNLNRKVELVTPESLSPHLGPHILRDVEYVSFAD